MDERAREYNNAAVVCMQTNYFKVAWDLFKGALELHLAHEKSRADKDGSFHLTQVSKDFIERADAHYQRCIASGMMQSCPPGLVECHGEDENFCHLFLFRNPINIPNNLPTPVASSFAGLSIIFNIALIEQVRNPSSLQSIQLYKLAASLLTGNELEAHLEVAIMNNTGVWYHESGDTSQAEKYMRNLSRIVESLPEDSPVRKSSRSYGGIIFNLTWFRNPRYRVSPAA